MKKIIIVISIILMLVNAVSYADDYTIDDAADTLVPYADEHIMTREECATILLKAVGVNDDCLITESYLKSFDTTMIEDVDYYSFEGRNIYLANVFFGENNIPTIRDFYENSPRFYGGYSATGASVISWMLGALKTDTEYMGADNLLSCACEVNLMDNSEAIILSKKIQAKTLKMLLKRFLNCNVYKYIKYQSEDYPKTALNTQNNDIKYIDVFNSTYKEKNIYIKNDGIYLGKNIIKCEDKQPFIDESGTMIMPVEWFAELFGFENMSYDEETGYVRLTKYKWHNDTYYIDVCLAFQNGLSKYSFLNSDINACNIDTPAKMIDGSMYVPLRTVCDSLMYNVFWQCE